jgi:hypothetical protein
MTRCENDSDSRPTLANTPGELYAIEGAGHVYIGKDDADLRMGFEQPQRFVRVARLQNSKPGLFQEIDAKRRANGSSSTTRTTLRIFAHGLGGFASMPG